MRSHGIRQNAAKVADGVDLRSLERFLGGYLPVLFDVEDAVMPCQEVARRQFPDRFEDGAVAGRVEERQVMIERIDVEIPRQIGGLEQRFDLRAEIEPPADGRVVDRLDA